MCFSAQASFSAAIAISALGIFTLSQANSKKIRLFAAVPLLFACQQAFEGIVWLTFNQNGITNFLHQTAIFGYLFFASMFWPIWIPTSLYVLETNTTRKKIILSTVIIGIIFSIIYAINWSLMGLVATIEHRHIVYPLFDAFGTLNLNYIQFLHFALWIAYGLCTVVVFFCSSVPWMAIMGISVGLSYMISEIFYHSAVGSIWCFFAAVLSFIICFIVMQYKKNTQLVER